MQVTGDWNSWKKRGFSAQPAYVKIAILLAGVVGNILTAWVLIFIGLQIGVTVPSLGALPAKYIDNERLMVTYVAEAGPAFRAGLKEGQIISGGGLMGETVS